MSQVCVSLFSVNDFINFGNFALKLKTTSDPVSQFLHDKLEQSAKDLLSNYSAGDPPSEAFQSALIEGVNEILKGASIYDENRFSRIGLSEKTDQLIAQSPKGANLVRLNRLLLEDAYPLEIAKSP